MSNAGNSQRNATQDKARWFGNRRGSLSGTMLPGVSRVAYLGSKEDKDWEGPPGKGLLAAAQALGV